MGRTWQQLHGSSLAEFSFSGGKKIKERKMRERKEEWREEMWEGGEGRKKERPAVRNILINALFPEKETSKIAFSLRTGQFHWLSDQETPTYQGHRAYREPRGHPRGQRILSTDSKEQHHFSKWVGQAIPTA